jgi:hypothetical protein
VPAFRRYREFLQSAVLPAARSDDKPGLSSMQAESRPIRR